MARAVLPNPSARAEWLFAGIIVRALHHLGHVPALDGEPGVHDLDFDGSDIDTVQMTMTTSSPSRVFRRSPCGLPASGGSVFLFSSARCTAPSFCGSEDGVFARSRLQLDSPWSSGDLYLENSLEDHGVSGQPVLDKIAFEISVWQRCRPLQLALTAHQLLRRREGVTLRRRRTPSSSLCSCWTCQRF